MTEWEALREECLHCRACTLADTRTNVVFGVGAEDAEVLFIGEAPGANEDAQGEPFVGRAGQFLDDMLSIIDLDRSQYFIGNVVKCRPPQNRDPLNVEMDACIGYLRNQVALIRPKIIVCLGRIAATRLIREDFKITKEHGQWFDRAGVHMMAIYHPSALLRDPRKRPESFEDLKKLGVVLKRAQYFITCKGKYPAGLNVNPDRVLNSLISERCRSLLPNVQGEQLSLFDNMITREDVVQCLHGQM